MKNGTYVLNLDEFRSVGAHLIALYGNGNEIIYFNNFIELNVFQKKFKFIKKLKFHNKYL